MNVEVQPFFCFCFTPATWRECLLRIPVELLNANGALLEVWLARYWVEGSERDEIGVGFVEMKGHKNLAGSNDAGYAELNILYRAAPRNDIDAIVRLQVHLGCVSRVHFEPCCGHHAFQHLHLRRLGAGVPMLHGAAGVKNEVVLFVRLFSEGKAWDGVQKCLAACGWEDPIGIKTFASPLHAAVIFELSRSEEHTSELQSR